MKTHFIAIGGSAMHNLALALHNKGYLVSGSDDVIFEPSKSRLEKKGILPLELGWFPETKYPLLWSANAKLCMALPPMAIKCVFII